MNLPMHAKPHRLLSIRERFNRLWFRIQIAIEVVRAQRRSRWLPSKTPGRILRQQSLSSCPFVYDEPDEGKMFLFLGGRLDGKFFPLGSPEVKAHLEAPENNQFLVTLDCAWGEIHYYYLIKDATGIWHAISKEWDAKMYMLGRTENITYRNLRWLIGQFYRPPKKRAEHPWFGL